MKRLTLIILTALLVLTPLASKNMQTVYTVRSDVYERVNNLCIRAGVAGPVPMTPLPARALVIALERINPDSLSAIDQKEYNNLMDILSGNTETLISKDYFAFDMSAFLNLSLNIADHSKFNFANTDRDKPDYDHREDTLIPIRYEDGALGLSFEMNFSDSVSIGAKANFKNNARQLYLSSASGISHGFDAEWPHQAGGSFGNSYFNLILGRYPHSAGNGITGNLLIGDNFSYQEVLVASLMSSYFTYNISVTRFDQQVPVADHTNNYYTDFSRSEFTGDQQFRITHRFDITAFDRARLAVNLTTLYNSTYGFDIRFFYPFVIGHNYFNYTNRTEYIEYDEANNLMTVEAEWAITKGLLLTFQLAVDQFQMWWENNADLPLACGLLLNLRYSKAFEAGRLNTWAEAVYTNPYLYLNGKYNSDGSINDHSYNLDYIVGYNAIYLDDYNNTGYVHGPDAIVFALGADYQDKDDIWSVGGSLTYRIKGMKGAKHRYNSWSTTFIDMSDAVIENDSDAFLNQIWTPSGGWDKAEHMIKAMLYGDYKLSFWEVDTTFYGALGLIGYANYNHDPGQSRCIPQLTIGARLEY